MSVLGKILTAPTQDEPQTARLVSIVAVNPVGQYPWSLVWFDDREEVAYRDQPGTVDRALEGLKADDGPIRAIARILTKRGVRWRFVQETEYLLLLKADVVGEVERLPLQQAEMNRWATIRYRKASKVDEDQTTLDWQSGKAVRIKEKKCNT